MLIGAVVHAQTTADRIADLSQMARIHENRSQPLPIEKRSRRMLDRSASGPTMEPYGHYRQRGIGSR